MIYKQCKYVLIELSTTCWTLSDLTDALPTTIEVDVPEEMSAGRKDRMISLVLAEVAAVERNMAVEEQILLFWHLLHKAVCHCIYKFLIIFTIIYISIHEAS